MTGWQRFLVLTCYGAFLDVVSRNTRRACLMPASMLSGYSVCHPKAVTALVEAARLNLREKLHLPDVCARDLSEAI